MEKSEGTPCQVEYYKAQDLVAGYREMSKNRYTKQAGANNSQGKWPRPGRAFGRVAPVRLRERLPCGLNRFSQGIDHIRRIPGGPRW